MCLLVCETYHSDKMFEMWNSVTSKIEQAQQSNSQAQQAHTPSGSIKGNYHNLWKLLV